jgi:hypothetical protein
MRIVNMGIIIISYIWKILIYSKQDRAKSFTIDGWQQRRRVESHRVVRTTFAAHGMRVPWILRREPVTRIDANPLMRKRPRTALDRYGPSPVEGGRPIANPSPGSRDNALRHRVEDWWAVAPIPMTPRISRAAWADRDSRKTPETQRTQIPTSSMRATATRRPNGRRGTGRLMAAGGRGKLTSCQINGWTSRKQWN